MRLRPLTTLSTLIIICIGWHSLPAASAQDACCHSKFRGNADDQPGSTGIKPFSNDGWYIRKLQDSSDGTGNILSRGRNGSGTSANSYSRSYDNSNQIYDNSNRNDDSSMRSDDDSDQTSNISDRSGRTGFNGSISNRIADHFAHPRNSTPAQEVYDADVLKKLAVDLVNRDRTKHGAPPVQQDPSLSRVAQAYANFLSTTDFFGHVDPSGRTPQDRARLYGVLEPVSENLAWEESNFEDARQMLQRAEEGMMAEPAGQFNHRYNILNPRSHFVGIGVARAGDKVVLVQEFTENKP